MTIDEEIRLALKHYQAGNLQQSEAIYREILKVNQNNADVFFYLGLTLQTKGQLDDALACYQKAVELRDTFFTAYNNIGNILQKKGQIDEAMTYYQKALQINPNFPEAYNNLGTIFKDKGQIDEAMTYYQKALQINPNFSAAYNNLGSTFRDKGQIDEALTCYQKAINLNPNFVEAHWNMAFTLLLNGNFKEGWKEYEWRWKFLDHYLDHITQPLWDGSNIKGRTVLLHAEQGLGDTIQFIRYAKLVAQLGARVIVGCQKELARIVQTVEGIDKVIPYGDPFPEFDLHCPLLRLPLLFGTTLESIPREIPYIAVDPLSVINWKEKIQNQHSTKFKIGLVWAGRPSHINDRNRSFSLEIFSPFAGLSNISFYSLQKGEAAKQAKNPPQGLQLIDFTDEIKDFTDTAAFIQNLDLIISADTAVAHLSGAIGKSVWTLLPFSPDWRWMLNREDSPWYPTMRLYRQPSFGDWKSVIDRISAELKKIQ